MNRKKAVSMRQKSGEGVDEVLELGIVAAWPSGGLMKLGNAKCLRPRALHPCSLVTFPTRLAVHTHDRCIRLSEKSTSSYSSGPRDKADESSETHVLLICDACEAHGHPAFPQTPPAIRYYCRIQRNLGARSGIRSFGCD